MTGLALVINLGSSSLKAALVDAAGTRVWETTTVAVTVNPSMPSLTNSLDLPSTADATPSPWWATVWSTGDNDSRPRR